MRQQRYSLLLSILICNLLYPIYFSKMGRFSNSCGMCFARTLLALTLIGICAPLIYGTYYYTHKSCPSYTERYYNYDKAEFDCKEPDSDLEREENIKFNTLQFVIGVISILLLGCFLFGIICFCCCCDELSNSSSAVDTHHLIQGDSDRKPIFKFQKLAWGKVKTCEKQMEEVWCKDHETRN